MRERRPAHCHADPFDRMLVAQALSEPLTLLTHDKLVAITTRRLFWSERE